MSVKNLKAIIKNYDKEEARYKKINKSEGRSEAKWVNHVTEQWLFNRAVVGALIDIDNKLNIILKALDDLSL